MEFNDPAREGASRPLPPVFSHLATTRSALADGVPVGPFFGPNRPGGRAPRRGTVGGRHATPGEDAYGEPDRAGAAVTSPVADHTAALAIPLSTEPDDVRGAATPAGDTPTEEVASRAGRVSEGATRLAEELAERLERLASRLRAEGDPRLALTTEDGDRLEAIIARVVRDHLTRDLGG